MADTATKEVINEIVSLIQGESDTLVSTVVESKIAKWTEEIATTTSSWVKFRDTLYILTVSWGSMKAQGKIKEALAKLSK